MTRRTAPAALALAAALLSSLTACGGDGEPSAPSGHPFTGTWLGAGGAGTGAGGTTLTVDENGGVRFKSTVDCTGTTAPAGEAYRFDIDCKISKFTGTARPPKGAKTFVMTWSEGDTTEFRAAP
ncbi:hypothetical protein SAMN04489712_101188 [Thermomonospora echinospora]|uniref:Lipoprotein n=1 Tax=Thermomonospora echinospora TaxID=1992 RepID=A0A1H5SHR9_9ACTN|nr:hypothetical protein [Thermomonospora echinospora]SEF49331.1 hypothetical protein SAMN04489712_101188 [Thermomonospora echinospora]